MLALSRRSAPQEAALRARVDLRTGLVCGGCIRLADGPFQSWMGLMDSLVAAKERWRRLFETPALSIALPFGLLEGDAAAAHLDAALAAAGFNPEAITLEIAEAEIARDEKQKGAGGPASPESALAAAERLRSRGWGLALRAADRAKLSLDARARNLFRELVQPRCSPFTQFFAAETSPLVQRLDAAKAAGMVTVIERLPPDTSSACLVAAGFDRFERRCGPG